MGDRVGAPGVRIAEPEVGFRYPLQAAVVYGAAAAVTAGIAFMLPHWWLMEQLGPIMSRYGSKVENDTLYQSFVLLVAVATAIAAGLVAFALWRMLLVPGRRFAFLPGAMAGVLVCVLLTFGYVLVLERPLLEFQWTMVPLEPPSSGLLLLQRIGLGVASALLGGVVASYQGQALRGGGRAGLRRIDAPT